MEPFMKIVSTFILLFTLLFSFSTELKAQNELLGEISFPNSGSVEAQDHFLAGVLYLHNFEYDDAIRSFKKARELDPDFAMAYYGEAKAHNHPIWQQQDKEAAVSVLNEFAPSLSDRQDKIPTEREKDLMMSLEILYGTVEQTSDLSKEDRDDSYLAFMEYLHEKYPDDHEITTFYGLAILGSAHEGRDFAVYMKAAAEMMEVWDANKKHPGAAHYIIHSFDDPIHAPLGLPMARAYSEIAPRAAHAQHMTSHIFLALGMWEEVIDANIVARDVQVNRQLELDQKTTVCGHYTWWLMYGYLQAGEIDKAGEVMMKCEDRINGDINDSDGASYGELWHFSQMRAHYIVDAEEWGMMDEWTTEVDASTNTGRNYHFANAYAYLMQGDLSMAREELELLSQSPESPEGSIQMKQISGLIEIAEGDEAAGIQLLEEAAKAESELPIDFGPPVIVKPSWELLGDVYVRQGYTDKAMEAYQKQLQRTPERYRSLIAVEGLGMPMN